MFESMAKHKDSGPRAHAAEQFTTGILHEPETCLNNSVLLDRHFI